MCISTANCALIMPKLSKLNSCENGLISLMSTMLNYFTLQTSIARPWSVHTKEMADAGPFCSIQPLCTFSHSLYIGRSFG